ncbi:hypothetical protein CEXT_91321 [Caerostris extrusa]|uniref:Uncharacterized protein n=1 Tax=Caerostris extrusa TaxID=172846 RepID=A0AAV4XZ11_CAEEX|nr:hypothetical protein CEXT_91321 [Caerostris extrusa]
MPLPTLEKNHISVTNAVKGMLETVASNITCLNTPVKRKASAILAAMNSPLKNLLVVTSVGRINKVVLRGMPSERII